MILAPTLSAYAESGAAIARPTFSRDFAGEKTLNNGAGPAITFTRGSNATYFNAAGTLTTATTNEPRFDHNPSTGASLGLLIEEARTNLLLNSATLATQDVTVAAVAHALSFYGTGEVVLSGAHSATLTGAGAFPQRVSLVFTPSAGTLTLTVTGTVQYAQLEAGAFATSYITTTGASATRAADVASVTPVSSFYNTSESTLFVEAGTAASGTNVVLAINNNGATNRMRIDTLGTDPRLLVTSGGVEQAAIDAGSVVAGTVFKMAAAAAASDFAASINGSTVATDTSGSMPTGMTHLYVGSGTPGFAAINSCVRRVAYWPKRLSNQLLQQLSGE